MERDLAAYQRRLRIALDASGVSLGSFDRDLRYTWVHSTFAGLPGDRILGKRDAEILAPELANALEALKLKVIDSGARVAGEVSAPDGTRQVTLRCILEPIRDESNRVVGGSLAAFDATDYVELTSRLRSTEERLLRALETGRMVAWTWDSRDDSFWQAGAPLWDFDSVHRGADSVTLIHPDDAPDYLRRASETRTNGKPFSAEIRLLDAASGEYRWRQVSGSPARDANGSIRGIHGITRDVHDHVRAREERMAAEKRLRLALQAGGMAAWVWDAGARSMWSSENASQIFAHGAPFDLADAFSGAPPEVRGQRQRELEALLTERPGDYRAEFRVDSPRAAGPETRRLDVEESDDSAGNDAAPIAHTGHSERWLETRATAEADSSGAVQLVLGVTSDITARKRAELALAESEARLTLALEAGRMTAWEWDLAANHIWYSHTVSSIAGDLAADTFEALRALIHHDDWPLVEAALQQAIVQRGSFRTECRLVHPVEHEVYWVEIRGSIKLDANGRMVALAGIAMDITERKQSEIARRESEERLQLALEAGRMAAWEWTYDEDRFWYSNDMPAIVGPLPAPSLDLARAFARPDDRAQLRALLLRAVDQRRPFRALHHTVHPETGSELDLELRCSLRTDAGGRLIRAIRYRCRRD